MYTLPIRTLLLITVLLYIGCSREPTKPNESERLLTDEELQTPEDPNARWVYKPWVTWIQNYHEPIRSLTSHNYTDLQFLKSLLAQKRIVQLGESSHGVKEFNLAKVRVIKFLHEEMGFNVLAFESSIFECFFSNINQQDMSAESLIRYSIFGVWHTQEVKNLFEYIKESSETGNPLILAGFDIQPSSFMGSKKRPGFLRDVLEKIDEEYAQHIHELDTEFMTKAAGPTETYQVWLHANLDSVVNEYDSLLQFLDDHFDELSSIYQDDLLVPLFARQIAWSLLRYIDLSVANHVGNDREAFIIRDEGMANNLEFLLSDAYPNEKIIVWAHNYHIRHDQTHVQGVYYPIPSMGTWVYERHQAELYTVGLYMYRGTAANPPGTIGQISQAASGSLESIFYRIRKKYSFVDLSRQGRSAGTSWMFEIITAKSWGVQDFSMVPRDQYNGILFIDTVSPPEYMWWIKPHNSIFYMPQ